MEVNMSFLNELCGQYSKLNWGEIAKYSIGSGIATFAFTTYWSGGNVAVGAVSGLVSATATLVNSLVNPILSSCIAFSGGAISYTTEFVKRFTIVVVLDRLLQAFFKRRVDLLASAVFIVVSLVFEYMIKTYRQPTINDPAPFFISTAPPVIAIR